MERLGRGPAGRGAPGRSALDGDPGEGARGAGRAGQERVRWGPCGGGAGRGGSILDGDAGRQAGRSAEADPLWLLPPRSDGVAGTTLVAVLRSNEGRMVSPPEGRTGL